MGKVFHLVQANWARMRVPEDDPLMDEFRALLDPINAIADRSQGFVWRLQDESGNSNAIRPFEDDGILFNMSVWESLEELHAYTYSTDHVNLVRARGKWFETPDRSPLVLWWISAGTLPTADEARAKLEHLWEHGPTREAFTFRDTFEAPNSEDSET